MYFIDKTNRPYRQSRSYDLEQLSKESHTNPDPNARAAAVQAIQTIKHEDKSVRGMREALIKAHRHDNKEEIKDIHDIVRSKRKYRNE